MLDNLNITINEELFEDSIEYESWLINVEASITFKGKSLSDWTQELSIPTISLARELNVNELELLSQRMINVVEIVMSNLGSANSAYLSSKIEHELNYANKRRIITDSYSESGKRIPSKETLDSIVLEECEETYRKMSRSSLIHEYWNNQSYKLHRLDNYIKSLNIAKRT